MRRSSKLSAAALSVTVACFAALALDLVGPGIQGEVTRGLALAAAPLSFALAIRSGTGIWRGPALIRFPVEYAVLRYAAAAEEIRAAAQVRGALGGAGHVYPARLVLAVAAWGLAGTVAVCAAAGAAFPVPCKPTVALTILAVVARIALPARPFWYRERQDGSIVLYPPSAAPHVRTRRAP